MKKLIIFIMIFTLAIGLCSCKDYTKDFGERFVAIKKENGVPVFGNDCIFLYDKETKIVYLYTTGGSHASMTVYYIMENGVPTIAIYGQNYMLGEEQ
jgi:hypothetical protein